MKTLPRTEASRLWDAWWDEMSVEWFKVEVLQDYYGEDAGPSLDNWLKGNKDLSLKLLKNDISDNEWLKICRNKVKQGVKLLRIHIIEEPLSPYVEWEIEAYKAKNIPFGGEKVHLINRSEVKDLNIPAGDLMIFDKKRAIVNTYSGRGRMTHQTFYGEPDDISHFLGLRKKLIKRAQAL
jgi:hypothetical protein